MPSHLDNPQAKTKKGKPKERPRWVHNHDIKGNKEADRLADRAAEMAELPGWLVEPLIDTVQMVRCIQLRIGTIVCNLPKRQHKKSINHGYAPTQGKETKEQAFAKSEHTLCTVSMIVQCSRCLSKLHFNSPNLFTFVRSPCNPAIKHDCHSDSMSITGQIKIGKQVTRSSHDMYSYRGIQYCNKCGFSVKRRIQTLI